jgi:hypothetical protein
MKMFKKSLVSLMVLFLLVSGIKADIAPDPDEMRVSSDLTVTTAEDLSDYRFFLDFMGAVHEVDIKSKAQTVIPSMGGGSRYSRGTILAIPKKNLTDFPEKLSSPYKEEGKKFSEAMRNGTIQGVIRLKDHTFSEVIKKNESKSWSYPTYRIERNGNTLIMKEDSRITPNSGKGVGIDFSVRSEIKSLSFNGYLVVIGTPLVLIIWGIWFFSKRRRKLNQSL